MARLRRAPRPGVASVSAVAAPGDWVELVEAGPNALCLAEEVGVDIADARRLARRIIDGDVRDMDVAVASISVYPWTSCPIGMTTRVILEAEDWRQLRLHALEALSSSPQRDAMPARGGRRPCCRTGRPVARKRTASTCQGSSRRAQPV